MAVVGPLRSPARWLARPGSATGARGGACLVLAACLHGHLVPAAAWPFRGRRAVGLLPSVLLDPVPSGRRGLSPRPPCEPARGLGVSWGGGSELQSWTSPVSGPLSLLPLSALGGTPASPWLPHPCAVVGSLEQPLVSKPFILVFKIYVFYLKVTVTEREKQRAREVFICRLTPQNGRNGQTGADAPGAGLGLPHSAPLPCFSRRIAQRGLGPAHRERR